MFLKKSARSRFGCVLHIDVIFKARREKMKIAQLFIMFLVVIGQAYAAHFPKVEVLVGGIPIPSYYHQGTTYLEAIKGKEYSIRISNPFGERIAVALAVDGLNTIDAQHTEARMGPKWILEPYESVIIYGWQVNARHARQFFFTNEERSYGARLGKAENLGLISAAFFKERIRPVSRPMVQPSPTPVPLHGSAPEKSKGKSAEADMKSQQREDKVASQASGPQPEYAATGIGAKVDHEVQSVYLDLEDKPFSTIDLRYEFRPVLVRLGVVPPHITQDPLIRRERAKGFREQTFCPEP
jgi:hypothetical protein